MWRGVRCSMTLLVLTVIGNSNTRGEETPLGSVEGESGDKNMCAPKCKITYIGDRNCDPECYVEACNFDGGDCEHNCTCTTGVEVWRQESLGDLRWSMKADRSGRNNSV